MLAQMIYFFNGTYLNTCKLEEGMGEAVTVSCLFCFVFLLPVNMFEKVSVVTVFDTF